MKFFLPSTRGAQAEIAYAEIVELMRKQLRWPITPRRIRSLEYTHDKRKYALEVGELDGQEGRYIVTAILESSQYIAYTRSPSGEPGVIILVSPDDVTLVEDFESLPGAVLTPATAV